ncbi:hypothetical protein GCM10007301_15000 [Azorhizobium oxalatiphilum]|uniref:Nuclease n=1 Tax=Azorhizobium oxalatiphilum TaxID=980631 RepID=A0A917BUI2_9HYPH|nr:thermonuclease family protein [Azorhizobium oxalatiphilum]GGF56369.1 hypothetical protein GCM10007301_15000 [Azorhizobium oxalatiphilum]
MTDIVGRLLSATLLLLSAVSAAAEHVSPATVRVIDGDTVAWQGAHYRLVGFDTPERGDRARCPAERALAAQATARLRQLIAAGGADLKRVPCSCRPGAAEGTMACNYGRFCGVLTIAGRDAGAILIREGLARPYDFKWGRSMPPATWCVRGEKR